MAAIVLAAPAAAPGRPDPRAAPVVDFVKLSRSSASAAAVTIQTDGKIVAAGSSWWPGDELPDREGPPRAGFEDFALARYLPDGRLDPSFGTAGKVLTNLGSVGAGSASAMAIQGDGSIVSAGSRRREFGGHFAGDFALVRYRRNGALDPRFGSGSKVLTIFESKTEEASASAVVVQPDLKVVAAGSGLHHIENGDSRVALARYLPDGRLDPSFGSGGRVLDFPQGFSSAAAAALQADGRIVIAGWSPWKAFAGSVWPATLVARDLPNGSPDSSFGSDGRVLTTFGDDDVSAASGVVLQGDGKIVTAGGAASEFALARYLPNGSLDPSFGSGGKVLTDFGAYDVASDVALQRDGKIVAAGSSATDGDSSARFALARYLPDGSLDPSFGSGGKVLTEFGSRANASALAIQADGKIVVAGTSWPGADYVPADFVLARYLPNGSLDPSFGSGGKIVTTFPFATRMASLSATRTKQGVLVRWRTGAEFITGGFHVYRERNGKRQRANRKLIPSNGGGSSYSFLDRRAPRSTRRYWLQEVKRNGGLVWYGPAVVKR